MAAAPEDELTGAILADRYRIVKKLGEGGMGSVYLAEHTTINKRLAIKVLSPEFSHKQDLVDRFLQEARAASMIDQQNVVEITDFGSTPTNSVFFVMEFLAGEDLSDTIKNNGPLPWARVKSIMLQICDALAAAHDAGIIHRDMKPENCFRIKRGSNEDFIKVLDFGIAKVTSDESEGKNLTRTGMIFGTPEYMSPEQAKGEKVDHRVDVYAAGVILYELLTGRVPFTADTFMGILTKHMFEAPPAPSTIVPHAAIPTEAEAIVLKAMQKDREYRFQSMRELADAIRAVGTGVAAVSVVQESVMQPSTGQIRYADRGDGGTHYDTADELAAPKKSNVGLFVGLGVFALILVGGGVAFGFANVNEDEANPEVVAAQVAEPDPEPKADPKPDPKPAPEVETPKDLVPQPTATQVSITVNSGDIEGTVYDDRDDSVLGKTNQPIALPASAEELSIYVSAPGYQPETHGIIPDKDKTLNVQLVKLEDESKNKKHRKAKTKGRKGKGHKGKGNDAKATPTPTNPTTQPEPASDKPKPKPKPKPTSGNTDLKDPFG